MSDPTKPAESRRPPTPWWVKVFAIIVLLVGVLVVLQLTGAIGEGHGPGRHGGAPKVTPRQSTGVGGPASAGEGTRTVALSTLDTMAFEPATVDVSEGETVTFAVTNSGKAVHEFTLGDAAMQQEHAGAMAHIPAGMSHDSPNSITLQPGETKRLTWRFGGSGTSLEIACHQPGHYAAGMRGRISIS